MPMGNLDLDLRCGMSILGPCSGQRTCATQGKAYWKKTSHSDVDSDGTEEEG